MYIVHVRTVPPQPRTANYRLPREYLAPNPYSYRYRVGPKVKLDFFFVWLNNTRMGNSKGLQVRILRYFHFCDNSGH
jgi:hypothetical protein